MVKRVLMIAFHFPPLRGSSGIQRTLKFAQYLPTFGWTPVVLSAHPRAYANTGSDQIGDIPAEVVVHRAFALDTSRHLSLKGRYPGALALPDRWVSWCFGAVPAGLRLIRKYRPDVIWSTYPIASANVIALVLHRITGIPWVADLRDPMSDVDYPKDPLTRRLYRWIEKQTILHCTKAVCTTPGTIQTYRKRFPDMPASRFCLIENGYDDENFADAESQVTGKDISSKPFVLVHSGVIYPSERDPIPFFEALSSLLEQGLISPERLQVRLRATAHDTYLDGLVRQHGIASLVSFAPHVPYREALTEMLTVDGLLVLQASNCNHQVPAKLYEYLRARRPILALTDPLGDTAAILRDAGIDTIAPLNSKDGIMQGLLRFLALLEADAAPIAPMELVLQNSRRARTKELAKILDSVAIGVTSSPHQGALR